MTRVDDKAVPQSLRRSSWTWPGSLPLRATQRDQRATHSRLPWRPPPQRRQVSTQPFASVALVATSATGYSGALPLARAALLAAHCGCCLISWGGNSADGSRSCSVATRGAQRTDSYPYARIMIGSLEHELGWEGAPAVAAALARA